MSLFLDSDPTPAQYLATDYECEVHETIFHDVPIDKPNNTVGFDNIKPFAHSLVELNHDLILVPLFAPDLAKNGAQAGQISSIRRPLTITSPLSGHLPSTKAG